MDALPIKEIETHSIKSNNDYMHACGHDIHTSALLKLAEYIANNDFIYNVCLIFQSKEETGGGSKQIVNSNVFERFNITRVIGMHVWPNLDLDQVYSNDKLMFGSYELDIEITGKENHISSYNKYTDATYCSYQIYKNLYKNNKKSIFHLGEIHSGKLRNISSNKCTMKYSIRFNNNKFKKENIIKNIKTKCEVSYNFKGYYPMLLNNKELLKNIPHCKIKTLKSAEDFGFYSEKAKILFLLYGLGKGFNLHTNNFNTTKELRSLYYYKLLSIVNIYKKMD